MTEDTFVSHLVELRDRMLRSIIAVVLGFALLWIWPGYARLYDFLAAPLIQTLPPGSKLIATGVITPFLIPLKVGLMAAFLLVLPYVLYQAWAFVAPGLYSHEKKLVLPLVISSTILFFAGVAFCYFVVFKQVFTFIANFAPASITPAPKPISASWPRADRLRVPSAGSVPNAVAAAASRPACNASPITDP